MVHSYTDKHSEFRLKVMIVDAPKDVTTWSLIGVDDDNWWNEFPQRLLQQDPNMTHICR